jgi:hypothetical protein
MGSQTHEEHGQGKASWQEGHANAIEKWAPKHNTRHVHKLGAPMQRKACPEVGRPNACPQCKRKACCNARHVYTSASCVTQRNPRHVRKMVAQMQNSSAMKMSTQGSTRLKDELEDG